MPATRILLTILCMIGLSACATAPMGTPPAGCSGVPGDLRTPDSSSRGITTHGPGGSGEIILLTAVSRPFSSDVIPRLYVFNENADHVSMADAPDTLGKYPVFASAEAHAYWGEVVDNAFYRLPWLDKCAQASMVREPLDFAAPTGGLLFMQFLAPSCRECEELTAAIRDLVAANPALPVRWVQVTVPRRVGKVKD